MPLTCAQIVTLACQIAKVQNFTAQGGQFLNMAMGELCRDYDFDLAKTLFNFNFQVIAFGNAPAGDDYFGGPGGDYSDDFGPAPFSAPLTNCGPFPLPANYLRSARDDVFYTIDNLPRVMINVTNAQFDAMIQQPGTQSYPEFYTVVLARDGPSAMFVWPPPAGAYPVTVRYYAQLADYVTPETNSQIPWFPDQNYLITRTAGELMKIADDTRCDKFLGDSPAGAQGILLRYLKLKDDDEDRAKNVTLDRRMFRGNFNTLPSTKAIGFP